QRAEAIAKAVLTEEPGRLDAMEMLGDIAGYQKQWSEALSYYGKLRMLQPLNADYHYKYGGVMGMIAKDSNKFTALSMLDDIRDAFLRAIELNPKHIEARWALIDYYLEVPGVLGGSERKAQRYANELAKLSPVDGFLAKGHIAEYFKRYTQAENYYRSAITVGKSRTTYERLANLYRNRLKRPDKAREVLLEYQNLKKS
ncbi:MAG TPA: hypothetical protein VK183_11005, partial [Flavobacterium sp.]|nr:hypothetical protein [Flavobacterium sp.]